YMELMCYRYPELACEYDIDPDLGGALPCLVLQVPPFEIRAPLARGMVIFFHILTHPSISRPMAFYGRRGPFLLGGQASSGAETRWKNGFFCKFLCTFSRKP
ncbi:MAG: hypothetical protein PUC45_02420, partial [Oscillospiraceae bacterium]|nr:hypothetical protein [Oscillospiraceae bacterium]